MGDINKIMAVTLSRGAALVQVMAAVMARVTGITNHTQGSTAEAAVIKIGKILNTTSMKNIHPRIGPEQIYRHYRHHQGFRTQRKLGKTGRRIAASTTQQVILQTRAAGSSLKYKKRWT